MDITTTDYFTDPLLALDPWGSGIGLSISQRLARHGHSVVVADLNGENAEKEAKAIREAAT